MRLTKRLVPGRFQCPPWRPTTDPNAFTVENLDRVAQDREASIRRREAAIVEALVNNPKLAENATHIVKFAWPYLSLAERARLLRLAVTPEVRAAAAGGVDELGLP